MVLDQYVLWLQVAVADVLCVHMLQAIEYLPSIVLHMVHLYDVPTLVSLLQLVL